MLGITRRTPVARDPWAEMFFNLQRRMGRIFNEPLMDAAYDWQLGDVATTAWTPVVDIFEEPEQMYTRALMAAALELEAVAT